jgi:hypothetical protein
MSALPSGRIAAARRTNAMGHVPTNEIGDCSKNFKSEAIPD